MVQPNANGVRYAQSLTVRDVKRYLSNYPWVGNGITVKWIEIDKHQPAQYSPTPVNVTIHIECDDVKKIGYLRHYIEVRINNDYKQVRQYSNVLRRGVWSPAKVKVTT